MILTRKTIDIVILVSLMVVSCQSVCPEEDDEVLPILGLSDTNSDSVETSEVSPKPESVSAKDTCELTASQRAALTEEAPKTEHAIIKKAGKKYKVITLTLPVEVVGDESSKETTAETIAIPTEQPINELSSSTETINYDSFMVGEKDGEPQEQEVKKEKVKVEKRKYKRDVGKKSASKKSSKRKNKEQGKKKSKK